jgi:hypothetical protein
VACCMYNPDATRRQDGKELDTPHFVVSHKRSAALD